MISNYSLQGRQYQSSAPAVPPPSSPFPYTPLQEHIPDYLSHSLYLDLPNEGKRNINSIHSHPIDLSLPTLPSPPNIAVSERTDIHKVAIGIQHLRGIRTIYPSPSLGESSRRQEEGWVYQCCLPLRLSPKPSCCCSSTSNIYLLIRISTQRTYGKHEQASLHWFPSGIRDREW